MSKLPLSDNKLMSPLFSAAINLILLKVGRNKDMHNTLHDFEFFARWDH